MSRELTSRIVDPGRSAGQGLAPAVDDLAADQADELIASTPQPGKHLGRQAQKVADHDSSPPLVTGWIVHPCAHSADQNRFAQLRQR